MGPDGNAIHTYAQGTTLSAARLLIVLVKQRYRVRFETDKARITFTQKRRLGGRRVVQHVFEVAEDGELKVVK